MAMAEPTSGKGLEQACAELAGRLGLAVRRQVPVARRIWGPRRHIDVLVTDTALRRSLGIECKYQRVSGTAEEKIPATIQDIGAWPMAGIVCFAGPGFSDHLRSFMIASGRAVEYPDLEDWLRIYFVLA